MELKRLDDSDAFLVNSFIAKDERGKFIKIFREKIFLDLEITWKESYYSTSKQNVFRGMHLQVNEGSHSKLVSCLKGSIIDFIVDLRVDKETFGKTYSTTIDDKNCKSIYIPPGYGHGFYNANGEDALVLYFTSTEYDPQNDKGVNWRSIAYNWPFENPILSARDLNLQSLNEFKKNEYNY